MKWMIYMRIAIMGIKLFKELFSDARFRPDQLKIYPCQVIQGAAIESLFFDRKYNTK